MMTETQFPTRRTALGLIGAAAVVPRAALAGRLDSLSGAAFGTRWRIVAPFGRDLGRLATGLETAFDQIDRQFSPWRGDSALTQFNASPAGAQSATPALVEVTAAALEIARRSEGAFDPTVGPLVARWGFGPIHTGGAPDWRGLSVGPGRLAKARADLTLDLCGIAKGRALDVAVQILRRAEIPDALCEIGGEFAALGQHPDGRDWRVAVEAPLLDRPAPAVLRLPAGVAVATSGTGVQSYAVNGRRYSHIVEPRNRVSAARGARSVTVIARDAMTADGWATALCAAGPGAGPELAAAQDIAALFLFQQDGAVRMVTSGSADAFLL